MNVWNSAKTHQNIPDVLMMRMTAFLILDISKEEITKVAPNAIFVKVVS